MNKPGSILIAFLVGMWWATGAGMAEEKAAASVTCELLIPVTTLKIPDPASSNKLEIAVALQIKNNTNETLLFSRMDTIWPHLRTMSGKEIKLQGGRQRTRRPTLADFRMLRPGESTTFVVEEQLYWQDNRLEFGGGDSFGGCWGFSGLVAGEYEFGISYQCNEKDDVNIRGEPTVIKNYNAGGGHVQPQSSKRTGR